MTNAIFWKELREQGTIVVALLVTGCGLIAGLAAAFPPWEGGGIDNFLALGIIGVIMLTIASGAIVASTLFAGEREAGTFAFLDRLPATHWQLWWRKVAVGMALMAVPPLGFTATCALHRSFSGFLLYALGFFGATLFGFAWGCVGSVLRRTALGACAVGLPIGVAVTALSLGVPPLVMATLQEVFSYEWQGSLLVQLLALGSGLVPLSAAFVFPLVLSARLFTATDREQDVTGPRPALTWSAGRFQRAKRFAWLLVRQHRVNVLWLTVTAGVAWCLLLIPDVPFIVSWPALTLVVGLLVGVVLFADEQGTESARFWGERRLRVGGVWGAKLAFGFAVTFGLVVLMLVPCVIRGFVESSYLHNSDVLVRAFRTGVVSPGCPFFTFLFVGPVYGLACGQLAALLFRKPVVALAVGTMIGGTAVALWFPSLFGGGLHGWQVWAPVAVTLAVSRLLTWPWATETLGQRGPMLRLATGLVAVTLTFAGGIAWRVLEVPEVAEANDDIEFARSLPTYDRNQSGRGVRQAVAEFGKLGPDLGPLVGTDNNGLDNRAPNRVLGDAIYDLLLRTGYPANRPDLDAFLGQYDGDWEQTLLEASKHPTGVFLDPTADTDPYFGRTYPALQRMVTVYALRGLKAQRDGDPADFVTRVGVLLAVVRTTRTSGPTVAVMFANSVEEATLRGVQHWLTGLRGRPELLRQMLRTLQDHERLDTYTPRRTELASQVGLRNGVTGPGFWLPRAVGLSRGGSRDEADVVAFAWAVPWERERLRRAVGTGNVPGASSARGVNPYLIGAPGLWLYDLLRDDLRRLASEESRAVNLRGGVLQVALRLHEAEVGRFPATLSDLVPKYLPAVPLDPFARSPTPLGYRVSAAGESIAVEPPEFLDTPDVGPLAPAFAAAAGGPSLVPAVAMFAEPGAPLVPPDNSQRRVTRTVAAGQPVVWSVGPDRTDNGGMVSIQVGGPNLTSPPLGDIVFIVPLPATPPAKAKSQ